MSERPTSSIQTGSPDPWGGLSQEVSTLISRVLPPFIGAGHRDLSGRVIVPLLDSSSGQPFAQVVQADLQDADLAVAAALDVTQGEWGAYSACERESLLYRFAELFDTNQQPLAELESLATGRAVTPVLRTCIPEALAWVRYLAGLPSTLEGHTAADQGSMDPFRCSFRDPRGTALLRVQCTESLTQRLVPVVSALSAGCPLVLICDDSAYPVLYFLCELLVRAGVPADALCLLAGDAALEERLLSHDDLFRPGVASAALPESSPSADSSSRMLVFEDADIDQVVEVLLERVLSPLNPTIFTPRIHAHESLYEELIEAIADRIDRLRCGPALEQTTQLGPLCQPEQVLQAQQVLARCRSLGLRVLGGEPFCDGRGLAPALIADDPLRLAHEALSLPVPVLMVQPFGYEDRTVRRANRDRNCRGISLFTQQLARIRRLSRSLRTEQIWVNGHYRLEPGDRYDPLAPYLRWRTLWIES